MIRLGALLKADEEKNANVYLIFIIDQFKNDY